jgi:hypothetical protein
MKTINTDHVYFNWDETITKVDYVTDRTRNNISLPFALGYDVKKEGEYITLSKTIGRHGKMKTKKIARVKRNELSQFLLKTHKLEYKTL